MHSHWVRTFHIGGLGVWWGDLVITMFTKGQVNKGEFEHEFIL